MEAIAGELQCPICLELLKYPVILPCSHVLCRHPCAGRLFNNNFIRCPVCRDSSFVNGGLDSLPRVITLDNIIHSYQNQPETTLQITGQACGQDDVACQLCDENPFKAIKTCRDCKASYCERCLLISHPDREPFIQHVLLKPTKSALHPDTLREVKCSVHAMTVGIFCEDCDMLCCLLCADTRGHHRAHHILTLQEASDKYQKIIESDIGQLQRSHMKVNKINRNRQGSLDEYQASCTDRNEQILQHCNGLVDEICAKRDLFLSDLEFEVRSKTESIQQEIRTTEDQCNRLQQLINYAEESLHESNATCFVQLAKCLHDRIERAIKETKISESASSPPPSSSGRRVLDLRKVKAMIRDITYLTAPAKPSIDVEKCTRSVHSVVLVLCASEQPNDVIDEYHVFYSTPQQSRRGLKSTIVFKTPSEERTLGRAPATHNAVCLIHDDLDSSTVYTFSVRAYNAAGESEMSEEIQCSTLSESRSRLKVPVIVESMCRTYSGAIQIHSPSPCDVSSGVPASQVRFYLLYREAAGANKIWKSISLCSRVDHRVFGLDANTTYDFVVMACIAPSGGRNSGESGEASSMEYGECQVSNMVTLCTENAAV